MVLNDPVRLDKNELRGAKGKLADEE